MLYFRKQFMLGVCAVILMTHAYLPVSYAQSNGMAKIGTAPRQLNQFIQQVLPEHPRLIAAQSELDAVKAEHEAATKAIYNPDIELETAKTDISVSTIEINQTIDWGDQRGAKTSIAKYYVDAAQAKFQSDRQQLMRDLLIALISYKNTTELAEVSRQGLKLMEDFYRVAQQRQAAGDLNQVELDLAQLAYSESMMVNAQILSEQVNAEQIFYALTSSRFTTGSAVIPDITFNFQEIDIPTELDAFILTLPQMRIVRANVEASKNTISLRESESSADPTISVKGGKEDEETLVGFKLNIPINIRNNYQAEITAAQNNYLRADQMAQQAFRNLRRDITSQTRHYQLTNKAWQQWQRSGQVSMNRQLKLLKRLWRAGDISTTDYLVQIKQNFDTQSAGIELHTTLWSSWLNWLEATAQIESWLQLNNIRNQ